MTEDDVLVGTAHVPEGVELRLVQHGDGFTILLEDNELMSTEASHSEEALATMTCARLGDRSAVHMLVGGYGMGYTLRAALSALGEDASVVVAEIVPEIIEWALGPMRHVTAGCLNDPRVMLVKEDLAMLIDAAREGYDAILLDVDNGPEGLTRRQNDLLYSKSGLERTMQALTPGGIAAIWSAWPDPAFTALLEEVGFEVSVVTVTSEPDGKGHQHVIWFARKCEQALAREPLREDTGRRVLDLCRD
ncbi:spermidine synthase [Novosphingobium sp. PY1]|uniref:spermine/spermidine synthase domain-containing protein n=1 Tax=Novosphingobium sp. PY1 TaxID=1882221 RepID=UPI001F5E0D1D|nr:spermidine synthase [Novosphingobium sp. PY1]